MSNMDPIIENTLIGTTGKFLKRITGPFIKYSKSPEQTRRIHLFILISSLAILYLISFSVIALIRKNLIITIIDFSTAIILFINLWTAKNNHNYLTHLRIGIILIGLLFMYHYLTGGEGNSGAIWYFTFPMVAIYLLGAREGSIACSILLIPVLAQNLIHLPSPFFSQYSSSFNLRFSMAYIAIAFFAVLFEKTRAKNQLELKEIHKILEEAVKIRTEELSNANLLLKNEVAHRIQMEKELRKSEKNYRLITESTSDLIATLSFSMNPRYTFLSPSHKEVMGYEPEDLVGKSALKLVHPSDKKKMLPLLKNYLKMKTSIFNKKKRLIINEVIEYRVKDKQGKWIHLESNINFMDNQLLFVSRDITDRKNVASEKKKLEEKLHRLEKMEVLGHLAGSVAHDLNNVLGGIVGYPDLLLQDLPENDPLKRPIALLKTSGQKAAAIVQDLLALTRRGVVIKNIVNFNLIIEEYLESPEFQKLLSYHSDINVRKNLEPELFCIEGSSVHLSKMLMNIISNGIESMHSGGSLEICTSNVVLDYPLKGYDGSIPVGNYIVLSVKDQGIGISAKDLKKIFEPFYTKKVMGRSGTGLGMAVVWGTIMDHNGEISIDSVRGKGTCFKIYFPMTRKNMPPLKFSPKLCNFSGSGEHILVVDDVPDLIDIVSIFLKRLKYKASSVTCGEDAIEFVKHNNPDLILLDMIMDPGIDGLETYITLKKINPDLKVIITSGYSETVRIKEALNMGVLKYLKKPFTIDTLAQAIWDELNKSTK
jgi:PAS domain S-box-containing protein